MFLTNLTQRNLADFIDCKVKTPYSRADLKNIFIKGMRGNDQSFLKALELLKDLGEIFKNFTVLTQYTYPAYSKIREPEVKKRANQFRASFSFVVEKFCSTVGSSAASVRNFTNFYIIMLLFSFVKAFPGYFYQKDIEALINFYCHE